jgi:acetolactate synthase-1/2/3 large subunit
MDGAQALIKTLADLGIEYIFGYSGGAAIPIFDALETVKTNMKFILVRHEQGAVHMADGYARATGKPAVVLVTSGPGAGNTVTGLMTAQMDSVPMIVLCGQQVTWMLGKDAFQEADIFNITAPVVKHNFLVKSSNALPRIAKRGLPHRHHRPPRSGAHRHSRRTSAKAPSPALLMSRWTSPATSRRQLQDRSGWY